MKIYCDYCGSQIETAEQSNCPHCGASYANDKELLEERERVKRLNELDEKQRQLDIERMKQENQQKSLFNLNDSKLVNRGAKGCIFGVITALCLLGMFFILMLICIFADEASEKREAATTAAETTPISVSSSMSMEPIEIPEIPEVAVPDIKIPEISVADITVKEP